MACRLVRLRRFESCPSLQFCGPWQSGLLRRIYNPCERVRARSVGPNPTGAAKQCYHPPMKKKLQVEKSKFDAALSTLLGAIMYWTQTSLLE